MSISVDLTTSEVKNEFGKVLVSLRIGVQEIIAELIEQDGMFISVKNPYMIMPIEVRPGRVEAVFPAWGLGHSKDQPILINLSQLTSFIICTNSSLISKYMEIVTGLQIAPGNMKISPPPGSMGPGRDPEGGPKAQLFDLHGRPTTR